jgi:hypothetical protein
MGEQLDSPPPQSPSPAPLALGLAFVLSPAERAEAVRELVSAFAEDDPLPLPPNGPPPVPK